MTPEEIMIMRKLDKIMKALSLMHLEINTMFRDTGYSELGKKADNAFETIVNEYDAVMDDYINVCCKGGK